MEKAIKDYSQKTFLIFLTSKTNNMFLYASQPKNRITLKCFATIILFLSVSFSCKKKREQEFDANGLPKATQIGAMIFACKINGENWISKKSPNSIKAVVADSELSINGINDSASGLIYEDLTLIISGPSVSTTHKLDLDHTYARLTSYRDCFNTSTRFGMAKSNKGEVVFTKINKSSRIISGTFWCDIPTDKCGVIKITEGRFDIFY